jgi:hypothetical protein
MIVNLILIVSLLVLFSFWFGVFFVRTTQDRNISRRLDTLEEALHNREENRLS